ncbi:hypothetical protein H072_1447 [Dactylellina haptotyla CBS 200.50]|uniref:Adenosine deaminase domain-containing protein n=1 Tax=Dactylellina haptotyla (strain CBS 200.50) TaxID=1284197 RepID=S8ANM6_DACHA|nr:hypothetical protein H072_1447 [Dactylellina haptotyla CBS 200.50]
MSTAAPTLPRPESTTLANAVAIEGLDSPTRTETQEFPDGDFCKRLPKLELHAHLTGSIRRETLGEIWRKRKEQEPDFKLDDPLTAIPPGKVDFDLTSFFPLFSKYTYNLVNSEWSVEYATNQILRDFEADGIVYLELRTIPRAFEETGLTKERYVQTIINTIRSFHSETMHTRLILAVDRQNTPPEAMDTVELAIKYKNDDGLVVGVDLCGNPAAGDVRIFRSAFEKAKENGLGITLHFAEIERQPIKDELNILLSFKPNRLGHVIHTDDKILREIRSRKLCIELCLSCNVYAKMLPARHDNGSFADHHFKYWWRTDCPVALGTDDAGVFLSDLSNEYHLASQHFRVNKYELWHLAYYSIDAIFGDETEKDRLRSLLLVWGKENGLDVTDDDESLREIIDQDNDLEENHEQA